MNVTLVNEHDEIIGYKERKDKKPGDIIRVTTIWVTNEKEEILLARRALIKDPHPGLWGPSVAGTVEEGETYDSNARKEGEEEIGLKGIALVPEIKLNASPSLTCFIQCYSAVVPSGYPFIIDESEVAEIKWFSKKELLSFLEEHPKKFIPHFKESSKHFLNYEN